MWDMLSDAASAVTGAVSSATEAVTTGIVGTGEKVPFSCQVPFKKFEESMHGHDIFSQQFHSESLSLRNSPKWEQMEFDDPDGGDMRLWTQPQVGTYHFLKAKFTIKKADLTEVFKCVTSDRKSVRAQFSKDICELEYFAERDDCQLMRVGYSAPQPAAGRDFCFLCSDKKSADEVETFGCSVDIGSRPEDFEGFVRGACFFCWHIKKAGDTEDLLLEYNSCLDPRGWAPPFLIAYFKSSATEEFIALRKLCSKAPAAAVAAASPSTSSEASEATSASPSST